MTNTFKIRVFALFDDSSADEILFSYFGAPQTQDIPIRAYSNDILDLDVKRSVADGASAALTHYEKSYKSTGERYCFAYKFQNDNTNQAVTGKSAGLAFCIKFALKIYGDFLHKELNFSIAATGIIELAEDETQIKAVEKINHKCEAVINTLKPGDVFLYPAENEAQLDQALKDKIIKNGISIYAVQNVSQAINILFEGYLERPQSQKKNNRVLVSFLLIIIAGMYFVFFNKQESCYNRALKNLQLAEYSKAKEISELCLQETGDDSVKNLLAKINSTLNLSINFIYIKDNISQKATFKKDSPLLMGMDDGYRFEIYSAADCFLYIFQFDSETQTEKLFPLSAYVLNQHYLPKNTTLHIPGGDNMFYLDNKDHHGTITIYIMASYWRLTELEDIYNRYEDSENRPQKRDLYNALISRIKQYSGLRSKHFKSLYLKELTFIQQ